MKTQKDLNDIFKQALADPVEETVFRDKDWAMLEQMLDKGKKRPGIVFWLPVLSSAAAILLFFGWLMLGRQATDHEQKAQQQVAVAPVQKVQPQVAAVQQSANNNTRGAVVHSAITASPKTLTQQTKPAQVEPAYLANNTGAGRSNVKNNLQQKEAVNMQRGNDAAGNQLENAISESKNTRENETLAAVNETKVIASSTTVNTPDIAAADIATKQATGNSTDAGASKVGKVTIKKAGSSFRPLFALTVLASSEQNGVGSLQQTSTGSNIGMMFSAELIKKFTISTGATYSVKPYTLPFTDYHTAYKFKNTPQYVTADCRVLDIPLNIGYQVYSKYRNKISVGTGLSSYIMMHESYTYDYGTTDVLYGPSYYAVKSRGKYMFSIMNLNATYERQVNSKVGISLQPYLKVPLTSIGYSQVKVETFGVAVGLNWNINTFTKPK